MVDKHVFQYSDGSIVMGEIIKSDEDCWSLKIFKYDYFNHCWQDMKEERTIFRRWVRAMWIDKRQDKKDE